MRMLQTNDLPQLLESQPGPCVSLYLDMTKEGRDPQTIRSRWNRLVKEANAVIKRNFPPHRARFLLEPMRAVPGIVSRPPPNAKGLALFRSFTMAGIYPVTEKAPELMTVADTFHLKPLLKVILEQERYFALALSQRRISLYEGNREGVKLVATFDADYDDDATAGSSAKGKTIDVPRGREGRDATVQFRPLSRVTRFVELTEPHIWTLLHRESSPLVLVGTPFMHRIYRNMNCYPYLSENGVMACLPQKPGIIHQRTWPIAERIFLKGETALCEAFFEEKTKDKASDDLHEIAKGSVAGRVATLLISTGEKKFGTIDRDNGKVELRDPVSGAFGDDVLDDIAQEVITRKGQAYALPQGAMPTASPIAAVFRW